MFKPLSAYIGLRYTRAKRRNQYISFISLINITCIALGMTAIITVLSVMNGFDKEIRARVFGMARAVTISPFFGEMNQWQNIAEQAKQHKQVTQAAPFVVGQGMLVNNGLVNPALITGIEPSDEQQLSVVGSSMLYGALDDLQPGKFGIVIGYKLAQSLAVDVGDKVNLIIPEVTPTPVGIIPRFKRFTVVGIFRVGSGFGYNDTLSYIHIKDAQKLFRLNQGVSGVRLGLTNLYDAPYVAQEIAQQLHGEYQVGNWTDDFGPLFHAIKLEKNMMFLVLSLIIIVAAFNLISSLVMTVTDKQSDIAILRTIGATPGMIMRIFVVQGFVLGVVGTLLGVIGGVLLSWNVSAIASWIERTFHVQLLSSNVYYVDYLPSQLQWSDVIQVAIVALISSFVSIIPAWQASKVQPAEALRYE